MNTTTISPTATVRPPLALHLRRLRQWFGKKRLRQSELAFLAGVSLRLVRKYEGLRRLPRAFEAVVAMSLALGVSVEELISPELLAALKTGIAERRQALSSFESAAPTVSSV